MIVEKHTWCREKDIPSMAKSMGITDPSTAKGVFSIQHKYEAEFDIFWSPFPSLSSIETAIHSFMGVVHFGDGVKNAITFIGSEGFSDGSYTFAKALPSVYAPNSRLTVRGGLSEDGKNWVIEKTPGFAGDSTFFARV